MSNINLQNKWDKWLIKGWYGFKKMVWCYKCFAEECCEELIKENGWLNIDAFFDFMSVNKIKRYYSLNRDGYHRSANFKVEVRGFIADNSPKLSSALLSDHVNRLEILVNIDRYKWVMLKQSKEYRDKWRDKQHVDILLTGAMLDGSSDWGKTKGGGNSNAHKGIRH